MKGSTVDVRRLGIVAAAMLLLLAMVGALAAWRAAEDREAQVASGVIPLPRHGDQVSYGYWDDRVDAYAPFASFAWSGPTTLLDPWGRPTSVDRVDVLEEGARPHRFGFEGGQLVPKTREEPVGTSGGQNMTSRNPFEDTRRDEVREIWAVTYDDQVIFWDKEARCLVRAGWQGMQIAAIPEKAPELLCPFYRGIATHFELDGLEVVNGVDSIRIDLLNGSRHVLTFWLAPGIPYPVAVSRCDTASCEGRPDIVLTGYQAGSGPELQPASSPLGSGSRNPEDFAFVGRAGVPSDGGARYPPDDALASIENDKNLTTFQQWRGGHAGLTVNWAWYTDDFESGLRTSRGRNPTWWFEFYAPDGTTMSVVTEREGECGAFRIVPEAVSEGRGLCRNRNEEVGEPTRCECLVHPRSDVGFSDRAAIVAALSEAYEPQPVVNSYHVGQAMVWTNPDLGWTSRPLVRHVITISLSPTNENSTDSPLDRSASSATSEWISYDLASGAAVERAYTFNLTVGPLVDHSSLPAPIAPRGEAQRSVPRSAFLATAASVPGSVYVGSASLALLLIASLVGVLRLAAGFVIAYSRLIRINLLRNANRAMIYRLLGDQPGLAPGEISSALAKPYRTCRYHLAILDRGGYLSEVVAGRSVRYYVRGSLSHAKAEREALRQSSGSEGRALAAIEQNPGIHAAELARRLGVSRVAASRAVRRLEARGLVRAEAAGRRACLYPRTTPSAPPVSSPTGPSSAPAKDI